MHLVTRLESYKIVLRIMMQTLGKINEIFVRMGNIQCFMIFMVMDTNSYDLLMGLNFLIKIGAVVDVKKGTIQMW
jgi:predicted aspartyl protease